MRDRWLWRSRWAALGAAVAVSVGGGGIFLASAAPSTLESTIVPLSIPVRVLDTRDPVNVGLAGPFVSPVSQKLQITGPIPTSDGTPIVVPAGATGVLLNVTAVGPTANGFISIRPGSIPGAPATSSLNVEAGSNLPNAVQVALPTDGANAGQIDITYDAYGTAGPTTELLIDVVGYMTNTGLQELVANVYTKAQIDSGFMRQGEIVQSHGLTLDNSYSPSTPITNMGGVAIVTGGVGIVQMSLDGPENIGGVVYGLKSVSYCLSRRVAPTYVDDFMVVSKYLEPNALWVTDGADRATNGCYTLVVNNTSADSYAAVWRFGGGGSGSVSITSLTTVWAPASSLPAADPNTGELPAELEAVFGELAGS